MHKSRFFTLKRGAGEKRLRLQEEIERQTLWEKFYASEHVCVRKSKIIEKTKETVRSTNCETYLSNEVN